MISRTLGDVKPEVARVCGATGMAVTDPRVIQRINLGIEELMNEGAFPGVVDRYHVRATDGNIILPANLDMLLEFTLDGIPQQIMSPWAEFVNWGPGPAEDLLPRNSVGFRQWWGCAGGNLYDRGESPSVTPIPVSDGSCSCPDVPQGPWLIRQYASVDETENIFSTVQGLDPNGLIVRSQVVTTDGSGMEWINGERLGITIGSSFVESTQYYSKFTAYTKPETNSYVRVTAWNGVDEIELSNYAPWETTPSYHHYWSPMAEFLNNCGSAGPCRRVVLARCRKRFVPVAEDTDVLIISNVLALKEIIIAQWKREAGNLPEYAAHKQTAIDIMKKEAIAYTGKVRMPALTFGRGYAGGVTAAIR